MDLNLFYYHLVQENFESSVAEYQQYNVVNSLRKRRNFFHCQDIVIYTIVCVSIEVTWKATSLRNDSKIIHISKATGPRTEPYDTPHDND